MPGDDALLDALATAIERRRDAELVAMLADAPAFDREHAADLLLPAVLARLPPAAEIVRAASGVDAFGLVGWRLERVAGAGAPGPVASGAIELPRDGDWSTLGAWCANACALAAADAEPEVRALAEARVVDLWRAAVLALMERQPERAARLLRWLALVPVDLRDDTLFDRAVVTLREESAVARYHARVAASMRAS